MHIVKFATKCFIKTPTVSPLPTVVMKTTTGRRLSRSAVRPWCSCPRCSSARRALLSEKYVLSAWQLVRAKATPLPGRAPGRKGKGESVKWRSRGAGFCERLAPRLTSAAGCNGTIVVEPLCPCGTAPAPAMTFSRGEKKQHIYSVVSYPILKTLLSPSA